MSCRKRSAPLEMQLSASTFPQVEQRDPPALLPPGGGAVARTSSVISLFCSGNHRQEQPVLLVPARSPLFMTYCHHELRSILEAQCHPSICCCLFSSSCCIFCLLPSITLAVYFTVSHFSFLPYFYHLLDPDAIHFIKIFYQDLHQHRQLCIYYGNFLQPWMALGYVVTTPIAETVAVTTFFIPLTHTPRVGGHWAEGTDGDHRSMSK